MIFLTGLAGLGCEVNHHGSTSVVVVERSTDDEQETSASFGIRFHTFLPLLFDLFLLIYPFIRFWIRLKIVSSAALCSQH